MRGVDGTGALLGSGRIHPHDFPDVSIRVGNATPVHHSIVLFGRGISSPAVRYSPFNSRIDVFAALGLQLGDAHVMRNAGGIVTDDVIRSLTISQRRLGTREVMVVQHSDCGLHRLVEETLVAELTQSGGGQPPFAFGAFADLDESVRESVQRLRRSPFLLRRDNVRGFIYDVETHRLREVSVESEG